MSGKEITKRRGHTKDSWVIRQIRDKLQHYGGGRNLLIYKKTREPHCHLTKFLVTLDCLFTALHMYPYLFQWEKMDKLKTNTSLIVFSQRKTNT